MRAYIHTKARRDNGTFDSFLTQEVTVKEKPLPWHDMTISQLRDSLRAEIRQGGGGQSLQPA